MSCQFQSTHPRGVRRLPAGRHEIPDRFQSTHPRGVRPGERHAAFFCSSFQSTHSRGVRLRVLVRAYSIQPFQSTHPRGVRPARISAVLIYRAVSIHAPAWGATAAYWPAGGLYQGFNPRTRVGCDPKASPTTFPTKSFQSTHPRGVRPPKCLPVPFQHRVSIHAPAWGATLTYQYVAGYVTKFQSTHPRGVRRRKSSIARKSERFQSTHPRGVRPSKGVRSKWDSLVSIHAPAWGATLPSKHWRMILLVSIHAPAWGATTGHVPAIQDIPVSIHAPAWGATNGIYRFL